MATKTAAKAPAPKKAAAKAAPAPAPAVEETQIEVGQYVRFLGYDESVAEEERILVEGEAYEVVGFTEEQGTEGDEDYQPGGDPLISAPNPDFDSTKKPHAKSNPEYVNTQVFPDEVEVLTDEEVEALSQDDAAAAAEAEVPAAKPAKAAAKGKAAAKAAPAPAPAAKTTAKTAAKGKGKEAPAKAAKGKAVAKKAATPESTDADALPELENEDAEVLALVESANGDVNELLGLAQGLEGQIATTEFQIGGLLYALRKDGKYLEVEGGEKYDVKGGWGLFIKDWFQIDYRKAQYLLSIYVNFTLAGIENPAQVVAELGWTKASKIAPALIEEGADTDDLIELAKNTASADLSDVMKGQTEVGGTKGKKLPTATLKFTYLESDAAVITETIAAVKEQNSLPDDKEALLFIVREYAQMLAGGEAEVEEAPAARTPAKGKVPAKRATAKA